MTDMEQDKFAVQLAKIGEQVSEVLRRLSGNVPEQCIKHSTKIEYIEQEMITLKNENVDLKTEIKSFQKEREDRSVWVNRAWVSAAVVVIAGVILAVIKFGLLGGI